MSDLGKLLVMAGGTGGHIYPAMAVAEVWKEQGGEVVWLGTPNSMESRLVPEAGIRLETIAVGGLRGKSKLTLLLAPFKLLRALWQALGVVRRAQPDVVLGMGGFASGPGGLAAWLLRRPLIIHEQNAIAGLTNRLLSKFASAVLEAFPGTFAQQAKVTAVGNPIRSQLSEVQPVTPHQPLHILVLGGSLGAQRINQLVPEALVDLVTNSTASVEVWHQTGAKNIDETIAQYRQHNLEPNGQAVRVVPYIDEMRAAYSWADLVLCRAGAMTVSELALVGRGSILIPFPFAVDDHQTANGAFLQQAGAAVLIQQRELDAAILVEKITAWAAAPDMLVTMGQQARALAAPDSTQRVVSICQQWSSR